MQTEGALTLLAIEMHMEVGETVLMGFATTAMLFAEGELRLSATVLHLVYKMLLKKQVKSAEDGRAVYRF